MYNKNINHRELRYFHGKVKSTLITTLDDSDYIYSDAGKYFPLFYFDNLNDITGKLKNLRNKCLIGDSQFVHFESDNDFTNMDRWEDNPLIKHIGNTLDISELNYIVSYLRRYINFEDAINLFSNVNVGEYGEYSFEWVDPAMVDEGIIINRTGTIGTVTLNNQALRHSTYILHLKIISLNQFDDDINISYKDIPLTPNVATDISFENEYLNNIISVDAKIKIKHDKPVITGKSYIQLSATPNLIYVGDTIVLSALYLDEEGLPVEHEEITFKKDGTEIGTAITDVNGVATFNYLTETVETSVFNAEYGVISSNDLTLTIKEIPVPTTVNLSCNKPYVVKNNSVTLTSVVKDQENLPMTNEEVIFKVGASEIGRRTTNSSGVATITYTPTSAGTVSLTASAGSVTSSSVSLRVKNNNTTNSVTVVANPNPATVNEEITVTVTALDSDNDPVSNRDVYIGSGKVGTTDVNGEFETIMTFSVTGSIPVNCSVDGKTGSVTIVVIDPTPVVSSVSLVSDKVSCTIGDSVGLTATVLDQDDNPMSNQTVTFKLNSNVIGTDVTDSDGEASLNYITQIAGVNNFTSTCSNVSSSTVNVAVNKKTATLSLSADSSTITVGESVVLSGVLNAGSGESVKIYQGNTVIDTVTTGSGGAFTKTVSGLSVGSYSFKAGFDGNSSYESVVSGVVNVTVVDVPVPVPASISLTSDKNILSYYDQDSCTLSATVLDEDDEHVSGETVSFDVVSGGVVVENIGSATTNSSGVANVSYSSEGTGDLYIQASVGMIVSEIYGIEDCSYYNPNTITTATAVSILLPSAFDLSFKVRRTSSSSNSSYLEIGGDNGNTALFGQLGSNGVSSLRLYSSEGSSSYSETSLGNNSTNTDTLYTWIKNGSDNTVSMNTNTQTVSNNLTHRKIKKLSITNNSIKELKIKPL